LKKLEIGGGEHPLEGYEQMNAAWGLKPLLFDSNIFDEIYSSHCIEHVPWFQIPDAISEAYRILKPGGFLEIHTVNFNYLVQCYLQGNAGDKWNARGHNPEMDAFKWINSRIFSVGPDDNWHKAVLTKPYLEKLFTDAGFTNLKHLKEPRGAQKHGPISFGIKGTKQVVGSKTEHTSEERKE